MANANQTNELELNLLKQLLSDDDEDIKQIKFHVSQRKDREPLLRALKAKLAYSGAAENGSSYGNKAGMVREAVQAITKAPFTAQDIKDQIKQANPDAEISDERLKTVLWQLKTDKELIRQVRTGNNRGQVAEYEKLPDAHGTRQDSGVLNGSTAPNEANRRARGIAGNAGTVTVGELEDFIRAKNRRMNEVVARFNVGVHVIEKLIEGSRIYSASRGWLKIRE
jgi:hypothetical protein